MSACSCCLCDFFYFLPTFKLASAETETDKWKQRGENTIYTPAAGKGQQPGTQPPVREAKASWTGCNEVSPLQRSNPDPGEILHRVSQLFSPPNQTGAQQQNRADIPAGYLGPDMGTKHTHTRVQKNNT